MNSKKRELLELLWFIIATLGIYLIIKLEGDFAALVTIGIATVFGFCIIYFKKK
ncbi:MAG: hypothetical protein WCP14_01410 [bacterium]